ncbi:MAG: S8 family serine peptidase [Saprospiraceae bacterium]
MKAILLFTLYLGLLTPFRGSAQQTHHVPGQVLVRLSGYLAPTGILARFQEENPRNNLKNIGPISEILNIWMLETDPEEAAERQLLAWLDRQPEVLAAQFNRILEQRCTPPGILPNDPLYSQQWHHRNTGNSGGIPGADLDSEQAWAIATGGTTPLGDTIVVAVIDGGIEQTHEDLVANLWRNRHEMPYDGMDNDNNGYVDDCKGWNTYTNNDNIAGMGIGHGTSVAALVGAKGNNNVGITGVNWNVKIMFVAGNSQESVILAAYDYILKARKRYNATSGQQGAFVVAVNCSWGITGGQPADAPLWCAAFDSLGAAGILGVAATANTDLDVDTQGDLPTACPSDYLISVTSLTNADMKAGSAAWGATSIDLGAYGKDVFTARPGNSYDVVTGTSFAAPQVAGAIALLYSAPCNNLAARARANPAAAALLAKKHLLGSTVAIAALQNKSVTGGRLQLYNLLQDYQDQCVSCIEPFGLKAVSPSGNVLAVHWSVVANVQSVSLRWRKKGSPTWTLVPGAISPFTIPNVDLCTDYEFSLRSTCTGNLSSTWTGPDVFTTEGCCSAPTDITVAPASPNAVQVSWTGPGAASAYRMDVTAANGFKKEYRPSQPGFYLNGLQPCTEYVVKIWSECGLDSISTPAVVQFKTAGCGACTDLVYCLAGALSAKDEWITGVQIGSWSHNPGGNAGYKNFTESSGGLPLLEIAPGATLPIILSPGFSSLPYKEHFRVYIDFNTDGDFDDAGELAFDPGFASEMPISGFIIPPDSMAIGPTRMRILMKYKGPQGSPPLPCENFEFGQVVDYCVHLGPQVYAPQKYGAEKKIVVYPQPAGNWAVVVLPAITQCDTRLYLLDPTGQTVFDQPVFPGQHNLALDLTQLPQGLYLLQMQQKEDVIRQKLLIVR